MNINNLRKCTMCKNVIDDVRINVSLSINAERQTSVDTWEELKNFNVNTGELLCPTCFSKLSELLAQMNSIEDVEE